jgi:hypothetical protein
MSRASKETVYTEKREQSQTVRLNIKKAAVPGAG